MLVKGPGGGQHRASSSMVAVLRPHPQKMWDEMTLQMGILSHRIPSLQQRTQLGMPFLVFVPGLCSGIIKLPQKFMCFFFFW